MSQETSARKGAPETRTASATAPPPPPLSGSDPLTLDAAGAAALVGVSRSLWYSLLAQGRTPVPLRLGRRTLWRKEELTAWVRAGCPRQESWKSV